MWVWTCECASMHVYECASGCKSVRESLWVCVRVCRFESMHVCECIYECVNMHVSECTYECVSMHVSEHVRFKVQM